VTGLGGLLQAVIYGYAGLDLSTKTPTATQKPVLPKSWKSITLKGVQHRGQSYDVRIDNAGSSITKTK
jgi:trehalose/maltose hydrolase-like predicted phosphorylase